jgi:transcriptional regulator with XRE-family HTH domain
MSAPGRKGEVPDAMYLTPEETLGTNVTNTRKLRRMSQRALAERMQALGFPWHQQTVSQVEGSSSGRATTVDELVGLALSLEVRVADLLDPKRVFALDEDDNPDVGYSLGLEWYIPPSDAMAIARSEKRTRWEADDWDGPGGPDVGYYESREVYEKRLAELAEGIRKSREVEGGDGR